ncbi:MAG: rhomboid family intramembrane serine protease [Leptolyngbyaceae cyanobacterium SM2_5_2]|nr:rhomboid family intramembrane serine protease [Leptolyngbyaceae cyanobacterium SM2_5_2]
MVPLRDENPVSTTPFITYGILGLNIAVFFFQLNLSSQGLEGFFNDWALIPVQLTDSFQGALQAPLYEWITLLSSQFLHGGFFHIGGNLLYLWVFGNNIEDQLGHVKFLIFYLGCGALAGLAQWFFDPYSAIPTIGASGAIAGVMGAYILRYPRAYIITLIPLIVFFFTIRIPAIFFLGFWFVQQAILSVASLSSEGMGGGVAYWAHSGGFIFGCILGPMLGLMREK